MRELVFELNEVYNEGLSLTMNEDIYVRLNVSFDKKYTKSWATLNSNEYVKII
jgi:hypothetical protein